MSKALAAPEGKFVCLTFDGGERELLSSVVPLLDAKHIPATLFVDTKAISQKSPTRAIKGPTRLAQYPLNWKALQGLMHKGWEIGSLGHEQVNLTEKSYLAQKQHISKSRELLTKNLGEAPRSFAYPFGAYDATTLSCVRESGFAAAVTMRPKINNTGPDMADLVSRYQLPRLNLSGRVFRDTIAVVRHAIRVKTKQGALPIADIRPSSDQYSNPSTSTYTSNANN